MAKPPTRSLLGKIVTNFINSLKPRRFTGDLIGVDHFGNKYFEIPANPSANRRKKSRYFEPPEEDNFEQELPAEWEGWLRGRRNDPPTKDEIMKNLAIQHMKKHNAIAIDAKAGKMTLRDKGMESFPKRSEYEYSPGVVPKK